MMKENTFLDMKMLSEHIHLSRSTIYKRVHSKSIPFIKLGGHILFDREQIDKWVRKGGQIDDDLSKLPLL